MNAPCSGEICIIAIGNSAVSSISACCTASGGVPCATTYWWISGVRKNDLGAAMAVTLGRALAGSAEDAVGEGEPAAAGRVEQLDRLAPTSPHHLREPCPHTAAERDVPELPRDDQAPEHEVVA